MLAKQNQELCTIQRVRIEPDLDERPERTGGIRVILYGIQLVDSRASGFSGPCTTAQGPGGRDNSQRDHSSTDVQNSRWG